jgi:two-component system sensor histidine kinase VicK
MISSDSLPLDIEEKTEVLYDQNEIVQRTLDVHNASKNKLDVCIDSTSPSIFVVPEHPVTKSFLDLKKRGIKLRLITEITQSNIFYCKELMKMVELRHLDQVKGNFGIVDEREYHASATTLKSEPPPQLVVTSVRAFVEQQQYFFEMLWKKAIPAKQRIKEIEENLKREFIETIQDSEETFSIISKVISAATEEILIIFSHSGTLRSYEQHEILELLKRKAANEISIRILIGTDFRTAITKGYSPEYNIL